MENGLISRLSRWVVYGRSQGSQSTAAAHMTAIGKAVPKVLLLLYEVEALDEETILEWWEQRLKGAAVPSLGQQAFTQQGSKFVDWLKEAESESSDEDGDDDDDEGQDEE